MKKWIEGGDQWLDVARLLGLVVCGADSEGASAAKKSDAVVMETTGNGHRKS